MPRFDQSFNGLCEQNLQDTLQLKQRYLDAKNKRAPKSKEKKQDSIQSSVHVVSIYIILIPLYNLTYASYIFTFISFINFMDYYNGFYKKSAYILKSNQKLY